MVVIASSTHSTSRGLVSTDIDRTCFRPFDPTKSAEALDWVRSDDFTQLSETFQQTRSGLKYVRGFDFVNTAITNSRNLVPTRALANLVEVGFLAAPTCDDDVRLAADDFIAGHNPVGRA